MNTARRSRPFVWELVLFGSDLMQFVLFAICALLWLLADRSQYGTPAAAAGIAFVAWTVAAPSVLLGVASRLRVDAPGRLRRPFVYLGLALADAIGGVAIILLLLKLAPIYLYLESWSGSPVVGWLGCASVLVGATALVFVVRVAKEGMDGHRPLKWFGRGRPRD